MSGMLLNTDNGTPMPQVGIKMSFPDSMNLLSNAFFFGGIY